MAWKVLIISLWISFLLPSSVRAGEKEPPKREFIGLNRTANLKDFSSRSKQVPAKLGPLYQKLAIPFDEITLSLAGNKKLRVKPVSRYIHSPPNFAAKIEIEELTKTGTEKLALEKTEISKWRPFELIALEEVSKIFKGKDSPNFRLKEEILVAVLRFHWQTRKHPLQESDPWESIREKLDTELLETRKAFLRPLAKIPTTDEAWKQELAVANELSQTYSSLQKREAQTQMGYAEYLTENGRFEEAANLLPRIEQTLPRSSQTEALRKQILDQAQDLVTQASKVAGKEQKTVILNKALRLAPTLSDAQDQILKLEGKYSILNVGVNHFPKNLSPATAVRLAERLAVELQFETLIVPENHPVWGFRYQPQLAAELPNLGSDKITLRLDPNAFWSNGKPVKATDIRHTVGLIRNPGLLNRNNWVWNHYLKAPLIGVDPNKITFEKKQAVVNLNLAFNFPILPQVYDKQNLQAANDAKFAKNPVGTGPFVYAGSGTIGKQFFVSFRANPYFAARHGKEKPYIREIRFFVSSDPIADLENQNKPIHLLIDPSFEELSLMYSRGIRNCKVQKNKRIYFLAVNNRKSPLNNKFFRKALAASFKRDKILSNSFRGKNPVYEHLNIAGAATSKAIEVLQSYPENLHTTLNGPFPRDCWAWSKTVRRDLFNLEGVRTWLQQVKTKGKLQLSLKYPNNDPRIGQACREIATEMESAVSPSVPLKINLVALSPEELQTAIFKHDYDLAYTSWEFGGNLYWLGSLFDPSPEALAKGGSNFLGYENDGLLVTQLQAQLKFRDFRRIRDTAHDIHAHLANEAMPFIPLWQLDTVVVLHPDLQTTNLDPLRIFNDVENWKLSEN